MFIFERGYLCCGCKKRRKASESAFIYETSCICKDCYSNLEHFADSSYFDACKNVEFLAPIFSYDGLYRDIFLTFKFNSNYAAGNLLGMAMQSIVKDRDEFYEYSIIIPVPISQIRYSERGYNQSEILAKYVSKALNIPTENALTRVKHSVPQSRLTNAQRITNVENAFSVTREFDGENVILFDDIYTTGSTIAECARALKNAGVGKICVISGAYRNHVWIDRTIHRFI